MAVQRKGAGRPASFTRDDLVQAALRLGPEHLNLGEIGNALSVPRTTIYNHVRSPEALGQLVLSHLLQSAPEPFCASLYADAPWQVQIETYARRSLRRLIWVGEWRRFLEPGLHYLPNALAEADHVIHALVDAGISIASAAQAVSLVASLVDRAVRIHYRAPEQRQSAATQLRSPEFRWVAQASESHERDPDMAQFDFNLRCAIAGIAAITLPPAP